MSKQLHFLIFIFCNHSPLPSSTVLPLQTNSICHLFVSFALRKINMNKEATIKYYRQDNVHNLELRNLVFSPQSPI